MYAASSMCSASYQNAPLTITPSGCTSTTRPSRRVNPAGWFIQAFAATTDSVPPTPATTTGTPVQKCGQGRIRRQP